MTMVVSEETASLKAKVFFQFITEAFQKKYILKIINQPLYACLLFPGSGGSNSFKFFHRASLSALSPCQISLRTNLLSFPWAPFIHAGEGTMESNV